MGSTGVRMEEHFQREFDILCGQGLAIVEADIIAQVECIGEAVCGDLPACRQVGKDGDSIGAAVNQMAEEVIIAGGENEPVASRHCAGGASSNNLAAILGR